MQPEKQGDTNLPQPPASDIEGGGAGVKPPESKCPDSPDVKIYLWKGDWMKRWVLSFRACAMALSFLSFVVMAACDDFFHYAGFSYVIGVAFLSMVYNAVQVGIKGHEIRIKKDVISPNIAVWVDFCGDQFFAYVLFSSASAGASTTTSLKSDLSTNVGLELLAASISMSVLALLFMAPSALISGYRLAAKLLNA